MKKIMLILLLLWIVLTLSCNKPQPVGNYTLPKFGMLSNCYSNPFTALNDTLSERAKLAPDGNLLWDKKELTCFFQNSDKDFIDSIMTVLKDWENCCGIKFVVTNSSNADIRVSFIEGNGSHSEIGKNSEVNNSNPSMNLDPKDVSKNSPNWIKKIYVLHEFGHAMGFIHEHQREDVNIAWDTAFVDKYYWCLCEWDYIKVDFNILKKYSFDKNKASDYDTLSIMHYDFPNFLTKDCKGYQINWCLSEGDKITAAKCYPQEHN